MIYIYSGGQGVLRDPTLGLAWLRHVFCENGSCSQLASWPQCLLCKWFDLSDQVVYINADLVTNCHYIAETLLPRGVVSVIVLLVSGEK